MVFGSREMVSGHRSMVLPGSDMPSALGLVVNALIANFNISHLVGFACNGDLLTKLDR